MDENELKTEKQTFDPDLSSSPPVLTKQLRAAYLLLDGAQQALFKRVYVMLWRYALKHYELTGIVFNYWSAEMFRLSRSLSPLSLSVLSYMYMLSDRGKNTLKSDQVYNSGVFATTTSVIDDILMRMQKAGYITRLYRDPINPYLKCNVSKHKIFIRFTKPGLKLMQDFEYTINYNTMRSSLADIAERGKQGRTLNKKRDKT